MSTDVLAMSTPILQTNRQRGFLRRLTILILFVIGVALWAFIIYQNQNFVSQTIMAVIAIIMIALAAGFGARFFFYERNWFIRLIAALASLILGLFVMGYATDWEVGIGPIEFWRHSYDWMEIAQLSGGILVSIIGLNIWWRRAPQQTESLARSRQIEPRYEPISERLARSTGSRISRFRSFFRRRLHPQKPVRLKVARQARTSTRTATTPQSGIMSLGRFTKSSRSSKRGRTRHRKPQLQISVYEEHRCPYCLEDVKRNDPRGVKECSVCHTLHHADCWEITGMCQVPHLNS